MGEKWGLVAVPRAGCGVDHVGSRVEEGYWGSSGGSVGGHPDFLGGVGGHPETWGGVGGHPDTGVLGGLVSWVLFSRLLSLCVDSGLMKVNPP